MHTEPGEDMVHINVRLCVDDLENQAFGVLIGKGIILAV